jgi:uncharacterized membrane protein YqjE
MAKPTEPQSLGGGEQSVGDLVAQAVKDVTQLARFEFDLAKLELRADGRRLILAAALIAIAAPAACLVLVLCSFALAYGLITVGVWDWLAFLYVALVYVILAAVAGLIVWRKVRGISGLRATRKTVQEDFAMLKRDEDPAARPAVGTG